MENEVMANKSKSLLLIALFIAFVILLGYVYDRSFGAGSYSGIIFALFLSLIMTGISYFQGDKIALWTSGARKISHEENSQLFKTVENLCVINSQPLPQLYIIPDPTINAFATGRSPNNASLAVTQGALDKLNKEELQGVLAHELSHIKNYDIRFMMLVAVLVGLVAILSDYFFRFRMFGRRSNDREQGGDILFIAGIVLAILSPIIAQLIRLAISRRREYLADASGAYLTHYPEGLASALEKIETENRPMFRASGATAHLYFSNPLRGRSVSNLFSTHPPIEERIKKLREINF